MDVLSNILSTFRVQAKVFHNGQFCGSWQIDTSGSRKAGFHIVTHGNCELLLEDGSHHETSLTTGDLVLLPRDLEHRVSSGIKVTTPLNSVPSKSFSEGLQNDGTGLVCGFLEFEHNANNFLFDMLPDYILIKINKAPWKDHLKPILDVIISESIAEQPGVEEVLNRLSETIFMIIIREHIGDDANYSGFAKALRDKRIYNVLEAIHNSPSDDWTLEQLSEIATMSRSAFISRFKSLLSITPINYIKQWRMKAAYQWFRDDNISIAEAADRCGYLTEAAFSKAFKRELGISPGKVRSGSP